VYIKVQIFADDAKLYFENGDDAATLQCSSIYLVTDWASYVFQV